MVRILHLADLHLGAKFKSFEENAVQRREDLSDAFKRAIDFAVGKKNRIDVVLICGDIFDTHTPEGDEVELFRAELARLKKRGIHSLLIPGNHDAYEYADSVWRNDFENAQLFTEPKIGKPVTIPINGTDCHFYGFAFDSRKSKEPFDSFKATDADGFHVALLHGSLDSGGQEGMHLRSVPVKTKKLAKSGMDYIALGHYHNFNETDSGGVKIVYPGTLEGLRWGEEGERVLVVAELSDGGVKIETQKINKRELQTHEFDLSAEKDAAGAVRSLLDERADENMILRLELTGTAGEMPEVAALIKAYRKQFFRLKIIDTVSIIGSEQIERIRDENSVRGMFVTKLLDGIDKVEDNERKVRELALRRGLESLGIRD